jgi:hypothetical protein
VKRKSRSAKSLVTMRVMGMDESSAIFYVI